MEQRSLCWTDISWFTTGGLMGGWRCRSVTANPLNPEEPTQKTVTFENHFKYTGPLSWVLKKKTYDTLLEKLPLENENLKAFIESQAPAALER